MSVLYATSLISNKTGDPRVDLHHDDHRFAQVSSEEARAWALNILEAAEAADQDAFLVAFHREELDFPIEASMRILGLYRLWRNKRQAAKEESAP